MKGQKQNASGLGFCHHKKNKFKMLHRIELDTKLPHKKVKNLMTFPKIELKLYNYKI